jgi:hypothetical protein
VGLGKCKGLKGGVGHEYWTRLWFAGKIKVLIRSSKKEVESGREYVS